MRLDSFVFSMWSSDDNDNNNNKNDVGIVVEIVVAAAFAPTSGTTNFLVH